MPALRTTEAEPEGRFRAPADSNNLFYSNGLQHFPGTLDDLSVGQGQML